MHSPSLVDQCEEFLTLYAKEHHLSCMEESFDKDELLNEVPIMYWDNTYAEYLMFDYPKEAREKTKRYFEEKSKQELFCDYLSTESQEKLIVDTAKYLGFAEQEDYACQQTVHY